MSFPKAERECQNLQKVEEPGITGIRVRRGETDPLAAEISLHLNLTLCLNLELVEN